MMDFMINNKVFTDTNLSLDEKWFVIVLKSLDINNRGYVDPTYEILMELCKTKRRAKISKFIKSLVEKGYIDVKKIARRNEYYFLGYLAGGDSYQYGTSSNLGTDNSSKGETSNSISNGIDSSYKCETSDDLGTDDSSKSKTNNSSNNETDSSYKCETSNVLETDNSSKSVTLINNNINDNINNNIYILDYWNSKNIINTPILTTRITNTINMALSKYTLEDIVQAINNYCEILNSSFYYSHRWTLEQFLFRDNGIARFFKYGDLCISYKDWVDKNNATVDKYNYNGPKTCIIRDYTKDYIKHLEQYID